MHRALLMFFFGLLMVTPAFASTKTVGVKIDVKEVALTFDDGPYGTSTEKILAILRKEHVPATFFVLGKNVEKFPDEAREIVADGDSIGNHTYDHTAVLTAMPLTAVREEVTMTDTAIASTTGVHTKLFRPPYGNLTKSLRKEIQSKGYRVVLWNIDPKDWSASSTKAQIVERVLSQKKRYMVVVMHDGRDTQIDYPRDNIISALPEIIEGLKKRGYTFVKYDETGKSN